MMANNYPQTKSKNQYYAKTMTTLGENRQTYRKERKVKSSELCPPSIHYHFHWHHLVSTILGFTTINDDSSNSHDSSILSLKSERKLSSNHKDAI